MTRTERLACAAALLALAAAAQSQPQWRFDGVERIVAVADVHGAYDAFMGILQRADVVDANLDWSGGATHLVVVGDVLDRGPDSRDALELIMALEPQARAAGGRVHFVLGNHELMNLTGDLRYVSAAEYGRFAQDESRAQRDAAFGRLRDDDSAASRDAFDARYPPGYFAHRAAFAADGRYGAWLLGQPVLVVIDGTAFVHGGLSGPVADLGGTALNARLAGDVSRYADALATLTRAGVLSPLDDFGDHAAAVDRFRERVDAGQARWPAGSEAAARRLVELRQALVFGQASPLWYRGTVGCSALIEDDRLTAALNAAGAQRVVVGHTPTPDAVVTRRMNGRVIRIDTGMLTQHYGGRAAALVIAGERIAVLYADEPDAGLPVPQPWPAALRPAGLATDALEAFLRTADVVGHEPLDARTQRLRLTDGTVELDALFVTAEQAALRPDVAAYRLDRLLGLGMVPVTVARTIDGAAGSLQHLPAGLVGETTRAERGLGAGASCPLEDQIAAMQVFDSLILNQGRTLNRIAYSTDDFGLVLIGHERSFPPDRGRPPYLGRSPVTTTPAWRRALATLDEAALARVLGDVLDTGRIRALLDRRDALLEQAEPRD